MSQHSLKELNTNSERLTSIDASFRGDAKRRTLNPEAIARVWIPGSLVSLAPRNDG
jgi:hypothetical protein